MHLTAPTVPTSTPPTGPPLIDPRGPRAAAAVTAAVLVTALAVPAAAAWLLAWQSAVFAAGAVRLSASPYAWAFRRLVAPRLGPPAHREPAAGPQFSARVGLATLATGWAGAAAGVSWALPAAAALVASLAALLAATGLCVGCRLYGLLTPRAARPG